MRHRVKGKKLNKKKPHLKSMIKNMVSYLIINGKLETTKQKAKIVSAVLDRVISTAKKKILAGDKMNAIRYISPKLAKIPGLIVNKEKNEPRQVSDMASIKVIDELVDKYTDRVSGFSRTFKLGVRFGDSSDMVLLTLV